MADTTLPGVMLTGNHAGRPAATAVATGTLYACSTHALIYQSDGATWSTWATLGGGAPAAHAASHEDGGSDEIDVTGLVGAGGGGGDDPIADKFGAPDTAFEFDTSSLTGLTAVGTATAEDADTSVPDHYYVKRAAASGNNLTGRTAVAPSAPFSAITKISDCQPINAQNFQRYGQLGIAEASPGQIDSIERIYNNNHLVIGADYASPSGSSAGIGTDRAVFPVPGFYLAIVVTTSTSVAFYYSANGRIWLPHTTGRNPGFTIGRIYIGTSPDNATWAAAAAFDFLRIWNSALTFVTI